MYLLYVAGNVAGNAGFDKLLEANNAAIGINVTSRDFNIPKLLKRTKKHDFSIKTPPGNMRKREKAKAAKKHSKKKQKVRRW